MATQPRGKDVTIKLCLKCFKEHFGEEATPQTHTWGQECGLCKKPTPSLSLLIKTDVTASMAIRTGPRSRAS